MPSKRKKNKRRMKKVHAQRRALEEQYAANPPVKASPGIAVCAPPTATQKKTVKSPAPAPAPVPAPVTAPAPEKIPEAVPVAVAIVETPKVEPEPVVPEPVVPEPIAVQEPVPVEVEVPEPEPVVLEETPAEVEIEVPAPIIEQEPVIETPPVIEPATIEAAVVEEAEPVIPETEPVTEVVPPVEAPVETPTEIEIPTVDTTVIETEIEQDAPVQSVEIPEIPDIIPEAPVEEAVVPVTDAKELAADPLVEDFVVTGSASAVESAIAESAAIQQEIMTITDTLSVQTESMVVTPAEPEPEPELEPEPVVAPAEEMVIDAEQTCLDMLSEEPMTKICDMACQMQLAVESVQLNSVEMSRETALTTHMIQEVPIEG